MLSDGPLLAPGVDLDKQYADMRATHIGSTRVAVYWSDIQPDPSQPLQLGPTDAVVLAAARQHISTFPVVLRAPAWARIDPADPASPPKSNSDYANVLKALVARYGPSGSLWKANPTVPKVPIRRWQIWNEPDLSESWAPAKSPTGWATSYVALLRASRAALKSVDPGSQTVLGGLTNKSWVDLRRVYEAGGKSAFDIADIHPFSARVSNVVRLVGLSRNEMRKAGDAAKPMSLSEIGWTSGKGKATLVYGWETNEAGQAIKVRQILTALARVRVSDRLTAVYWSTWLSPQIGSRLSFDYGGLRRLSSTGAIVDKPALAAFRQTAGKLSGAS